MLNIIIILVIDAVILMVLMNFFAGERRDFVKSLITALLGAVGAAVLTGLLNPLGANAGLVATLITAFCIGLAVSFMFEIKIGPALIIGVVYAFVRIVVYHLLASIHTPAI